MHPEHSPVTKVAAIYDIHGNLPALEAVLAEIEQAAPDYIIVGGDVAAGPFPSETLDRLMALNASDAHVRFLTGNADREMVARFDAPEGGHTYAPNIERTLSWTVQQMNTAQRDFLAGFSVNVVLDIEGLGPTRFCHGSPRSDEEIITRVTSDERLARILADVREPGTVCGHTHIRFDRRNGGKRVINAGSVGSPYEGRPGAFWVLLGPDVDLRHTAYDYERAAALVRASGFPDAESFAGQNILNPREPDEVSAFFEQMALDREAGQ